MSGEAPKSAGGQPRTDPLAAVRVPDAFIYVFIGYVSVANC
jgi:hypothetical protein